MGDYSAQAVVNTILNRMFPDDPIVGEEDAADLRLDSGTALRERIIQLANETLTAPLVPGEQEEWGLGPNHGRTTEQLLDAIDRGAYNGGRTGRESSLSYRMRRGGGVAGIYERDVTLLLFPLNPSDFDGVFEFVFGEVTICAVVGHRWEKLRWDGRVRRAHTRCPRRGCGLPPCV